MLGISSIAYRRRSMNKAEHAESGKLLTELSKLSAGYQKYLNSKLKK
jgi:hypothetical protein